MKWKEMPKRYIGAELGVMVGATMGYIFKKSAPYEEVLLGAYIGYLVGAAGDIEDVITSWFDKRRKESKLEIVSAKTEDGIEN